MSERRYAFTAMGCPCELRFHAPSRAGFRRAVARCVAEIRRFDRKYSSYRKDSLTSRINEAAGRSSVPIDEETAAILDYAAACHEQSGGLFDITAGVYRHVWTRGRRSLPSASELDRYRDRVGWCNVRYSRGSVYLPTPGMELDFGGIVKEYAADAAAQEARRAGIGHGLVNLGGDMSIVGPRPDGQPWAVGVVHPMRRDSAIATLQLAEGALATSGGYERFVEVDGKRYSHLIDPRTGWPVEGLLSVSVVADQALVAGAVASIGVLQPPVDGIGWLERCGAPYLAVGRTLECHGSMVLMGSPP